MKKFCELCKSIARIYCDSDQASLCWSCDSKVHSANFLVARHSRNLLCRVCQSPTPWTASGEKLGPSTASVCEKCVVDSTSDEEDDREESQGGNDVEDDDDYDGDEDGENELEMEDEEDGDDNQVVPLCSTPPPAPSSSSSEEFSYGVSVKRKRENVADLSSEDDDTDCSSVHKNHHKAVATDGIESNRATLHNFFPSSTEAIVERLKNFRHRDNISGDNDAGPVVDVSKATRTVGLDLNSSDSS